MVHSGYEATAVSDSVHHPLKAALASLRGVRTAGEMAPEIPLDRQRPAEYVFSHHVEEAMARLDRSGLGGSDRAARRARRAGERGHSLPGLAGEAKQRGHPPRPPQPFAHAPEAG